MGAYINRKTLIRFMSITKNLVEGKACAVRFCNRKFKCGNLDLDAEHRAIRIMTRSGYMKVIRKGSDIDYVMTPKGIALYDNLVIYLGRI